jgi:alpha-tubulin suppressor-like RCC1 family protein
LRADGTVVAWGDDSLGQCDVPAGLSNVIAISAGGEHSLALKNDGTVVAWGNDIGPDGSHAGQSDVPWNLSGVVAIAGGDFHSLAMKADGTIVAWGDNSSGQLGVPAGLTKAVAIAAGGAHSLAIQEGGTVFSWGDNLFNQSLTPSTVSSASEIAAGAYHSLALLGQTPTGPTLINPGWQGSTFSVSLQTIAGKAYFLQSKSTPTDPVWSPVTAILGNGNIKSISDSTATTTSRFYRVRQQ